MHAVSTREETVKAIVLFSILAVGPTINVDSLRCRTCSHGTVHQITLRVVLNAAECYLADLPFCTVHLGLQAATHINGLNILSPHLQPKINLY